MRVFGDSTKNIQNVLHFIGQKEYLFYVSKITNENFTVVFYKKQCLIRDHNDNTIARGVWSNDMYSFDDIPNH